MDRQIEVARTMESLTQATDRVICHCLQVTESEILSAASFRSACTIGDVIDCTSAGAGCTACHRRIIELLQQAASAAPRSEATCR